MKKFIYILIIALSCSVAIAKPAKTELSENTLDIFKAPAKSSILNSPASEQQCVMECFQTYRSCLRNYGIGGSYWICELTMEQCTAGCAE